ncbi:MAG TPA: CoA transferase [Candidatus Elarobacter sp.]|nr:CoA transferase [Candidatus Elarobacter sp.]
MSALPLAGIRVVDLSSVVMGPWATYILAGYGADVIKVEPPDGDVMRYAGPSRHHGMGSLFMFMNRGKRSIVLDLKRPAARDALLRVCERADVFITNVRPAAMRRLGLGYDDVAAVNARVVYVDLVGYGQDGPYAEKPAYDDLIQGISGLAATFRRVDGEPRFVPALISDRITGMNAVHAVLAALFARERTGVGQHVEVPMFETMAELVLSDHIGGNLFDPPAGDFGYNRALAPNRRPFRTLDGYVCVLLYTEKHWERFFEIVAQEDRYRGDPRLSDPVVRRQEYDSAYRVVAELVATRTSAEWLAVLNAADIPVVPLEDVADLLDDEHLRATGFFSTEMHPTEGALRSVRRPLRFSGAPAPDLRQAPSLGEHGDEVLREAGLDEESIAQALAP